MCFAPFLIGFVTVSGMFLRAVRIDPFRDSVTVDAESSRRVRNSHLVSAVSFLNVELFEFFQGFIEHDLAIKHVFNNSFQARAYLHQNLLNHPIQESS